MKKYLSILFVLSLTLNTFIFAQESESDEAEISTVEALLQLVKEGKTKEQSANAYTTHTSILVLCCLFSVPS